LNVFVDTRPIVTHPIINGLMRVKKEDADFMYLLYLINVNINSSELLIMFGFIIIGQGQKIFFTFHSTIITILP